MTTKLLLLLTLAIACVHSFPVLGVQSYGGLKHSANKIQSRIVVTHSNLPLDQQDKVAAVIQRIYDAGAEDIPGTIRIALEVIFPTKYTSVFINASGASYRQDYYIRMYINGNDVVAFGLPARGH